MNLKVKKGSRLSFVMPDGCTVTWEAVSDTDSSKIIDVVARFETEADAEIRRHDA